MLRKKNNIRLSIPQVVCFSTVLFNVRYLSLSVALSAEESSLKRCCSLVHRRKSLRSTIPFSPSAHFIPPAFKLLNRLSAVAYNRTVRVQYLRF